MDKIQDDFLILLECSSQKKVLTLFNISLEDTVTHLRLPIQYVCYIYSANYEIMYYQNEANNAGVIAQNPAIGLKIWSAYASTTPRKEAAPHRARASPHSRDQRRRLWIISILNASIAFVLTTNVRSSAATYPSVAATPNLTRSRESNK